MGENQRPRPHGLVTRVHCPAGPELSGRSGRHGKARVVKHAGFCYSRDRDPIPAPLLYQGNGAPPESEMTSRLSSVTETPATVVKKVDFGRNDQENPPFAAPTVQDGSDRESHPETPSWSPLKPFRRPEPANQPEPDWICVSASPAGIALQAPVSAAERSHPSTPIRASLASLQVR